MKKFFMLVICLFCIASCAAKQNPDGVQDLKPGEKSVIQPPANQQTMQESRIQERNL